MIRYFKFFLMVPVLSAAIGGIALGGAWMWTGAAVCLILVVGGDAVFSDDFSSIGQSKAALLEALLYSTFPFIVALLVALTWMVAQGDPLGLGAAVEALTGWDLAAARE